MMPSSNPNPSLDLNTNSNPTSTRLSMMPSSTRAVLFSFLDLWEVRFRIRVIGLGLELRLGEQNKPILTLIAGDAVSLAEHNLGMVLEMKENFQGSDDAFERALHSAQSADVKRAVAESAKQRGAPEL